MCRRAFFDLACTLSIAFVSTDKIAHRAAGLPTLCDKALGDCDLSGASTGLKGQPLDGVSAWGPIARGEPSLRHEIMHDLWYQHNPDPESRPGLKPHW